MLRFLRIVQLNFLWVSVAFFTSDKVRDFTSRRVLRIFQLNSMGVSGNEVRNFASTLSFTYTPSPNAEIPEVSFAHP